MKRPSVASGESLDGRPLADFPLLYNGQSNFTDLSSIPVAMIERIDILPGNQSSIYGSAAIAGVVNIILKKNIDGAILSARLGGYDEGGGRSGRVSFADSVSAADNKLTCVGALMTEVMYCALIFCAAVVGCTPSANT